MLIRLTATNCTVNTHNADWVKDRTTIAAMLKARLGLAK